MTQKHFCNSKCSIFTNVDFMICACLALNILICRIIVKENLIIVDSLLRKKLVLTFSVLKLGGALSRARLP